MRATSDLEKLRTACTGRLLRIRKAFSSVPTLSAQEKSRVLAFSVIELDNLVISTLREFTISTLQRARTASGARISVNRKFGGEQEVAAYMLSVVASVTFQRLGSPLTISRKDEPRIRDPRLIERILLSCSASNTTALQNALALNTSLFSDLATIRNFYAHRNEDTWHKVRNKARSFGALRLKHPDELMLHYLPMRSVSLLQDWLDDTELFFELATE